MFLLFSTIFYFSSLKFLKNEWTPLYIALRAGKDQIVKLLIEMGANINAMSKVLNFNFFFFFFRFFFSQQNILISMIHIK